jgi:hypothetical protein
VIRAYPAAAAGGLAAQVLAQSGLQVMPAPAEYSAARRAAAEVLRRAAAMAQGGLMRAAVQVD